MATGLFPTYPFFWGVSGGVKIGFPVAQVVANDLEHLTLLPWPSQS